MPKSRPGLCPGIRLPSEKRTGGVRRGSTVLNVNGIDVVNNNTQAGVDQIITTLFDPAPNSVNTIVFRDPGSSIERTVVLTAQKVAFDAVPVAKVINVGAMRVGYMVFSDHNAAAETQLKAAVEQLDGPKHILTRRNYRSPAGERRPAVLGICLTRPGFGSRNGNGYYREDQGN